LLLHYNAELSKYIVEVFNPGIGLKKDGFLVKKRLNSMKNGNNDIKKPKS